MVVLIKTLQVIMALSLLVLIHEFGHFIFARIFKIRVDKFYLFFDAGFKLFSFKPKNSETEFGVGWLPLGGYCKIAGMIDESMDLEQLKQEPQPWEFRSKPAWQRLFVMIGGVLFNVIMAIFLYGMILYNWGDEYISNDNLTYGMECDSLAQEIGFRNGDRVVALDDYKPQAFHELQADIIRRRPTYIYVERGGDTVRMSFDQSHIPFMLHDPGMLTARIPFEISQIPDTSINASAGFEPGDRIVAINGNSLFILQDIQKELQNHRSDTVSFMVMRNGTEKQISALVSPTGMIGVIINADLSKFLTITEKHYSFFAAIPAGINRAYKTISNYLKELGLIFSPKTKAYKSVGSFIAIGQIFPSMWDWQAFWTITALLSIMLAVVNILPIPALDGGHTLFLLYEIITGKKPGDKFLEHAQTVGMILLILLMVFAFGNDIIRLFK